MLAEALHAPEGEVVGPALRRRLRAVQARNVRFTHFPAAFRSFGSLFPPLQRGGHARSACSTRFGVPTHAQSPEVFPTHGQTNESLSLGRWDIASSKSTSPQSEPQSHFTSVRLDQWLGVCERAGFLFPQKPVGAP